MRANSLDGLLESLYASVLEPERLEAFCGGLAHATGSHVGAIMVQDMQRHVGRLDLVVGADPLEGARYNREFAADNLWLQRGAARLVTGAVLDSDEIVPRTELRRSRYFNEYLRGEDVEQSVALCAHFDGENVVTATVCRSGGLKPYTAKHLDLLRRVAPHWVNAYGLQRRLGWLEGKVQALESALDAVPMAMFLLDRAGQVLRFNEASESLMASGRLRRSPAGLSALGASESSFDMMLRLATAGVPVEGQLRRDQGSCVLFNAQGQADLMAVAHPLPQPQATTGEAAVLFVQAVAAPCNGGMAEMLRRAFQLTASEAALAVELYRRADITQAARARGISLATARTRLQIIFGKTGEHGQAALMRLLAAIATVSGGR